ncbi:MAG: hypothetical protein WD605_03050 [Candidatus Paceibacterota bacterium]
MDGKNGELGKLKSEMEGGIDDPHDSWEAESFKATLEKEKGNNTTDKSHKEEDISESGLNKAIEDVKEGDVSSITSRKVVYGAARAAMVGKQEREFEKLKEKKDAPSELTEPSVGSDQESATESDESETKRNNVPSGIDLSRRPDGTFGEGEALSQENGTAGRFPDGKKSPEWREHEKQNGSNGDTKPASNEGSRKDVSSKKEEKVGSKQELVPIEGSNKESSPEFEKAKTEWKDARDRARKLEEEYKTKYEAYILKESKGFKGVTNWPRRMFGLQPRLTEELEDLKEATTIARQEYKDAGKNLKETKLADGKTVSQTEKLSERYQRMLAYHLMVGTQKRRLEAQREAIGQAWGESKYLRPTQEALGRHKYIYGGAALGVAIISAGVLPVLAALTAGIGTRLGLGKILDKTYIESARKKLAVGTENVGNNYFESEFLKSDKEMEHLIFNVGSREARAKTIATTLGVAAGIGAGVGTAGYVNGSGMENISTQPELPPDVTPIPSPEVVPAEPSPAEIPADNDPGETITPTPDPEPTPEIVPVEPPSVETPVDSVPEETITPTPDSETAPEAVLPVEVITHTVEKGDNVWNILEGKGPDANPVGGKSEVLEGMTMTDRQAALDRLVEYAEQNPDFAKEVGAVKSDGNIHRIYPGEEINISMLDDKLRELLGIGETTPESTITPEVTTPTEEVGEVEVQPEIEPATEQVVEETEEVTYNEAVPEPYDINSMRVGDILAMQEAVESGDPQILEELNLMGLDKGSYEALNEAISSHIRQGESYDMTLPLSEWMNQYGQEVVPAPIATPESSQRSPILDRVSFTPSDSSPVAEEAIAPVAPNVEAAAAVKEYVNGIEKSSGFIFNKPSVAGTFENLKGLSIGEFKAMAANDNLSALLQERGVSYNGFERWGEALQKQVQLVPANDTEMVGDYVTRIANANVRTA